MYAPDMSGIASIAKACENVGYSIGQLTYAMSEATHILIQSIPVIRRAKAEADLGYKLPNWVWQVGEYQRRTEGSGNGREMRE